MNCGTAESSMHHTARGGIVLAGFLAAFMALPAAMPAEAASRQHPVVAGSSTVFPFAAAVAERVPGTLVLPMGSGAGIAWFCEGLGPATPDAVVASRALLPEEREACHRTSAAPLEHFVIGRDGIVLVTRREGHIAQLGLDELWLALAARVPDPAGGEQWVINPYESWRQIRADLPDVPIRVLGPPATSGTRDSLAVMAFKPACARALAARPLSDESAAACGELRRDGAWMDAGEHDDGLVARLLSDRDALGLVGFGALARNHPRVAAVCLDGVCPSAETISAGTYPLTRSLHLYLKSAHREFVPALDTLVQGFFDPIALAPGGRLARLGLVPADVEAEPVTLLAEVPGALPRASRAPLAIIAVVIGTVLLAIALAILLMRRPAPVPASIERAAGATLGASAVVAAAVLALVLATLVVPAFNFFLQVSPLDFLGGLHWSPESAIRASQVVGEGAFGVAPVVLGSVLVALIAMLIAFPLALAAALHGHAWAGPRQRDGWRLGLRLAALVPAVVFGLFAALTVGPAVASMAAQVGLAASAQSTLAAGVVVGIMLMPVLAARLEEALASVPASAAQSAIGLGATRWEVLRDVLLPAAAPGIGAAVLLSVSRALGETLIVLMAAGLVASLSVNPLGETTTLTAQMVALMSGTHELDNVRTQLPFVLGLLLAALVLPLNAWALRIMRKSDVTPSPVI